MKPGSLVQTRETVYTIPNYTQDDNLPHPELPAGTVGIIMERPNQDRPSQYLVNFVGGQVYWMYHTEIEPYIQ